MVRLIDDGKAVAFGCRCKHDFLYTSGPLQGTLRVFNS